jgi:glycosyltransferase A (GT-A) superfamily protein (DUF2064 family)
MRRVQYLVIAKAPVPGAVKTRLCPPCTPVQAARVAAAALADTLDAVTAVATTTSTAGAPGAATGACTLVLAGGYAAPAGWRVVPQRGDGLAERLVHAYADTGRRHAASLLVGMDTPQLTPAVLAGAADTLGTGGVDAVLGTAADGGWWALGLRDPADGEALRGVPMSTPDTGAATLAALRARGLTVAALPVLRDVDTAADAWAVAGQCRPDGRFPRAVAVDVPRPAVVSS